MAQPLSEESAENLILHYEGPYANLAPIPQDVWNNCLHDFTFKELSTTLVRVNKLFCRVAQLAIFNRIHHSIRPFSKQFKWRKLQAGAAVYQFAYADHLFCTLKTLRAAVHSQNPIDPLSYYGQLGNRLNRLDRLPEIKERAISLLYFGDFQSARETCGEALRQTDVGTRILEEIFREKRFRKGSTEEVYRQFFALARFSKELNQSSFPFFAYCIGELLSLERFDLANKLLAQFPNISLLEVIKVLATQLIYSHAAHLFILRQPRSALRDACLNVTLANLTPSSGTFLSDYLDGLTALRDPDLKHKNREIFKAHLQKKARLKKEESSGTPWEQIKILASTAYPEQISLIQEKFASLSRHAHFHESTLKRRLSDL